MRSKLKHSVAIARWLVLSIVVLHAPVRAADFRTSDFGKPCAGLAEREAALGSEPIQWRKVSPHLHAFQAVVFGHETSVVYLCTNGLLRTGNYFFSKQSKADALKTLRAVYDGMVATYGVPSLDRTPWQYGEAEINPDWVADEPQRYSASWLMPTIDASVHLISSGDDTGPNWEVVAIFSRRSALQGATESPESHASEHARPQAEK